MTIQRIFLGYWYQRSTLHLAEIHDFLVEGTSPLHLDKAKLKDLRAGLKIQNVDFKVDVLEYVTVQAANDITIKIYEDGLVVLSKQPKNEKVMKSEIEKLTRYFEDQFTPAVAYLFSLGAPVPKELAGIKTVFPYFIVTAGAKEDEMKKLLPDEEGETYFDQSATGLTMLRSQQYFVINAKQNFNNIDGLIEMLIFLKEFKAQLHHYLNLHRTIWENIAEIKEQPTIHGRDVQDQRNKIESYKKTIELIEGRMNQMALYMGSREGIIKNHGWEEYLSDILKFKYENLRHSLDYVKSLWVMTKQYVESAVQVFNEINAQSTKNSVQALTVISSVGVVSGVLNYLQAKNFPQFTLTGVYYFAILVIATWLLNHIISWIYQAISYKINDIKLAKNIK
jgi:hypothetical protein